MSRQFVLENSTCVDKDHACVWKAIDALAEAQGLTSSGLARRAGLDPTTFNRSKRSTNNGRPRWPSTESIAKVLAATGTAPRTFGRMLEEAMQGEAQLGHLIHDLRAGKVSSRGRRIPSIGKILWPMRLSAETEASVMIVAVVDHSVEPHFRKGALLIALRDLLPDVGGMGLFRPARKRMSLCRLAHRTEDTLSLQPLTSRNAASEIETRLTDLDLVAQIVWSCHMTGEAI